MFETIALTDDEFNKELMLNDWLRERLATDAYHSEQALRNDSHKTFSELMNDY